MNHFVPQVTSISSPWCSFFFLFLTFLMNLGIFIDAWDDATWEIILETFSGGGFKISLKRSFRHNLSGGINKNSKVHSRSQEEKEERSLMWEDGSDWRHKVVYTFDLDELWAAERTNNKEWKRKYPHNKWDEPSSHATLNEVLCGRQPALLMT